MSANPTETYEIDVEEVGYVLAETSRFTRFICGP